MPSAWLTRSQGVIAQLDRLRVIRIRRAERAWNVMHVPTSTLLVRAPTKAAAALIVHRVWSAVPLGVLRTSDRERLDRYMAGVPGLMRDLERAGK